jgi:hypothetical protein
MNPIIHKFLYTMATVLIPFVTGAVGLYYSIIGHQHTGLRGFRFWIWAASVGLIAHIVFLVVYTPPDNFPKIAYHSFWIFWCLGYTTSALLGTWGTVLLVRHLIAQAHDQKA